MWSRGNDRQRACIAPPGDLHDSVKVMRRERDFFARAMREWL